MVEGELVQSKKSFMGMPVRSQCPEHKIPKISRHEDQSCWRSMSSIALVTASMHGSVFASHQAIDRHLPDAFAMNGSVG